MSRGRAIILRTETRIAPFGDPVAEVFFSGETLAETQDRALGGIGLEVVRAADPAEAIALARGSSGRCLLLLDRVYLSEKAARDFWKAAAKAPRPSALALTKNASVEYTRPLQDVLERDDRVIHDVVEIDPARLPPAEDDAIAWMHRVRDEAQPVDVPKREIVIEVPLPVIGERERAIMRYPLTSTVVVAVDHWVHVLWLNQLAFPIRWLELFRRRPLWALWRALSAFSMKGDRLLLRLVRVERGAQIHPTASLSGSIVGAGAKIGAHVTLKNSIVGAGAIIEDHSVLLNSVVGPRALITSNTFLVSSAVYPDATVGNYKLQVSLIGRGAYVHVWAGFIDAKFVGHVAVQHRGALVSTERSFLGSVVGHRAQVVAKILIHPGREIPNDAMIVMRPDEVVSIVPADIEPGRPMVRDRGTLVPLGREQP
ncbi:MAG: hypothetical protein IT384_19715 [Deltaproteobacteria bacterium]|nr:hypothetical protein [Deltaproteobacteria bacterium]